VKKPRRTPSPGAGTVASFEEQGDTAKVGEVIAYLEKEKRRCRKEARRDPPEAKTPPEKAATQKSPAKP